VIRSCVGAFWPGACLLEDLLLARFPDLVAELLPPVDLPAEVLLPVGAEDLTAPDSLETVRFREDFVVLGFAVRTLGRRAFRSSGSGASMSRCIRLSFRGRSIRGS